MAGRDEIFRNSNLLQGLTFDGTIWGNKNLYILEVGLKIDASHTVKE